MKQNWLIVPTVMLLLTLSCRLPFSSWSGAAEQPLADQDLDDAVTNFISTEGAIHETLSEKEASEIDQSLPWVGGWWIDNSIEGVDCNENPTRGPATANCKWEIDLVNRGKYFHVFETQEEQKSWLNKLNESRPAAARFFITLEYPVFKWTNPHLVLPLEDETHIFHMQSHIGAYDPVTDTFSGDFQFYFPMMEDHYDAMITGTWTATRR